MTMFSQWFSGEDRERYLASPHKRRIDHIGSSLLELRYASEAVRQHLHEWLRFSAHFERDGSAPLPTLADGSIRHYLAKRVKGLSASRSRVLRACQDLPLGGREGAFSYVRKPRAATRAAQSERLWDPRETQSSQSHSIFYRILGLAEPGWNPKAVENAAFCRPQDA